MLVRAARIVLTGALCLKALCATAQSKTVPGLIVQLHSPNPILRDIAAQELGHSADPRAVRPLIAALRDPNVHVGNDAAIALGQLHATAAIPALVRNLQYAPCGNYDGTAAADALAAIGTPALPSLVAKLRDTPFFEGNYVAFAVGRALDGMKSDSVVSALRPLLRRPNPALRNFVLRRISYHPGPAAVSAALTQLHSAKTRENALSVLGANLHDPRTRRALLGLVRRLTYELTDHNGEKYKKVGTDGMYMLVGPEMNDNNSSDSVRALHLLAQLHDPTLLPLFLHVLQHADQDEDPPLGLSEIVAIGPSAVPPLIHILTDPTQPEDRRGTAAFALGSFDDPRVVPPLLAATKDPSCTIREGAFQGKILSKDPAFLDTLLDALAHDQWGSVRQFAAEALRTQHDPRVGPALIAALKDEEQAVRSSAIEGLTAQHNTQAVPALIAVMQGATGIDSDAAGLALGVLGDRRAVAPLVAMLAAPGFENCWVVLDALRQLNVATEQPALLSEVRRNLAQAGRGDCHGDLQKLNQPPLPVASNASPYDLESLTAPAKSVEVASQKPQDARPLQPLLKALHDPSPSVRLATTKSLQYREEPDVTHTLVPLLRDPNPQVRHAAAKALSGCPAPTFD